MRQKCPRTLCFQRSEQKTKTESLDEQIMSADKYPSKFSRQMEAIVFIILGIFFAIQAVLKIGNISQILYGKSNPSILIGSFLVGISSYGPFPWKRS